MKTLIVDDDQTSRVVLEGMLRAYGPCCLTANGKEALAAVEIALKTGEPYRLICLDIKMPEMDGQSALAEMRRVESRYTDLPGRFTKILMATAHRDKSNVLQAFREQCDGYLVKPIDRAQLLETLHRIGILEDGNQSSEPTSSTLGR